jgi:hypothetical protein
MSYGYIYSFLMKVDVSLELINLVKHVSGKKKLYLHAFTKQMT